MDTSLAHENARLRALLQTQQDTIRQMAEYNRLLSQRVAAYASEINRLKALVAKLQRMQFGKSSEKLRAKTERQIQEAQERISALQEEMAETLGEQYDPVTTVSIGLKHTAVTGQVILWMDTFPVRTVREPDRRGHL